MLLSRNVFAQLVSTCMCVCMYIYSCVCIYVHILHTYAHTYTYKEASHTTIICQTRVRFTECVALRCFTSKRRPEVQANMAINVYNIMKTRDSCAFRYPMGTCLYVCQHVNNKIWILKKISIRFKIEWLAGSTRIKGSNGKKWLRTPTLGNLSVAWFV